MQGAGASGTVCVLDSDRATVGGPIDDSKNPNGVGIRRTLFHRTDTDIIRIIEGVGQATATSAWPFAGIAPVETRTLLRV